MIIWIDAQLSPALAPWLSEQFAVEAFSARHLGLVGAKDRDIFAAARAAKAVVLTKDSDFVLWQERLGAPPQVVWLRCGNTSNEYLRKLFVRRFPAIIEMLVAGEPLVEIADPQP